MNFVFVTHYKSNKASTMQEIEAETVTDAKERAASIMQSSVDISDISIYEFVSVATKVETIQWS